MLDRNIVGRVPLDSLDGNSLVSRDVFLVNLEWDETLVGDGGGNDSADSPGTAVIQMKWTDRFDLCKFLAEVGLSAARASKLKWRCEHGTGGENDKVSRPGISAL